MNISKRTKWLIAVGLLVSLAIELAFIRGDSGHGGGFWHHLPLFDFAFGFAGCWIIVVASKAIGHGWLQQPERYYDAEIDSPTMESDT